MSVNFRKLIGPTALTIAGIAFLTGLGIWQLDRKGWKENLIATVTLRINHAPQDLPPRSDWKKLAQESDEYRRVAFSAELLDGQEALVYTAGSPFRPDVAGPGYWVFAPAQIAGGSIVLVNRGFVPADHKDLSTRAAGNTRGTIEIVGVMRWPEQRGLFTPDDDPKTNVWYLRDIKGMAAVKNWAATAPFYIDQEAPVPPGGLPSPGKLSVILSNNHLQYAITWFGLALALVGVYGFWLVARIRRRI